MKHRPVDVMALAKEEPLVAKGIVEALTLLGHGDLFYRHCLVLSYRFARLNAVEETVKVLSVIPPEWFRTNLPGHMQADPNLATLAERVANLLNEADVVMMEYEKPKGLNVQKTAHS